MTYKLIATAVMALGLGTAAFAQSNSEPPTYPQAWEGDISAALFDDQHTLRSQDEIKTNWAKLSADQQAMVKKECDPTTASIATKPGDASENAQPQGNQMADLCDMINKM